MNHRNLLLGASIAAALAIAPAASFAQPQAAQTGALAGIHTSEAARVTRTVSNNDLASLPNTRLHALAQASASQTLDGSKAMNHLQLILKPSANRQAAMEATITSLHDPKSALFQHWLTPTQFGDAFGVQDSDIAAVTAWLKSEGFTVNSVYPNKTQIDFSGTVDQVNKAFHTRESLYTIDGSKHLANASDISIPAALHPVIAGVMGLNDFHATALHKKSQLVKWNPTKKAFEPTQKHDSAATRRIDQAINFSGGQRGLVPNDMVTMYGIRTLRNNGVTGQGITIAVVEDNDMVPGDWYNFVGVFNLGQYGGTFAQVNPAPASGPNNCYDPNEVFGVEGDNGETLLDAEWATAIAPGAHVVVASCADYDTDYNPATDNFFGGVFLASSNLINNPDASTRPNIISASYGYGEYFTDSASKTAIDQMWAQADAEGISVFVSTGDSGSNASFNGGLINGAQGVSGVDASSFATSPHVTGVGGTDLADVLDGTTSKYFAPTHSVVGGSALSYVPEIPWNESCGNGVAAKAAGFSSAIDLCKFDLKYDPNGYYVTSEGGSGGPSKVNAKPAWQSLVHNAANDHSRDLPDVSLFAGSYGGHTWVITCTSYYPCSADFSGTFALSGGTSLSSPMFAGIQALMDQGLAARGLTANQGNAAPTLYALAAKEYGSASGTAPSSLAACNADNGTSGTSNCVFHNVTRGSISTSCYEQKETFTTENCYFFDVVTPYGIGAFAQIGLTTTDATPTGYTPSNKAFQARPGWSFASGLGSVNATNLLIAWRAFVNAPPAAP